LELYERFIAGANAGIVAQTAIYPMEVFIIYNFFILRNRRDLAKLRIGSLVLLEGYLNSIHLRRGFS